jgi:hypothetical protein
LTLDVHRLGMVGFASDRFGRPANQIREASFLGAHGVREFRSRSPTPSVTQFRQVTKAAVTMQLPR